MNDSYHIEELEIRISNYLSGNCTEEEKEALFVRGEKRSVSICGRSENE